MRISIPVNVLAAVLACSAVVSVDGFSVPKSPSASSQSAGAISQISLAQSPRAFLFPGMSNNIAPTQSSSTALFAKKKAKKTPAAAALEQLEALEALEADLPDPIGNGAPVGVAAAVDEPLSKKEQMALEKQRKKEAKAAKKAAEQAQKAAAAESQKAQRAAALAALESGDEIPDPFAVKTSGLSKKEQMALEKKAKKEAKKAEKEAAAEAQQQPQAGGKKDPRAAALKALEEMERAEAAQLEAQAASDEYDEFAPPPKEEDVLAGMDLSGMSKKEIKKLRQKEEKKRDKMAAKAAKKAARKAELEASGGEDDDLVVGGVPGEGLESSDMDGNAAVEDIDVSISFDLRKKASCPFGCGFSHITLCVTIFISDIQQAPAVPAPAPAKKEKLSLEEKIRKERPPPRIRVMESSQPNYSALRLEGVGVTFRDQEVVKDATWGVQTGDRIGLVGQNGAGKTTQLRILAGELEPTTGDVVKSSKDLRVAMLRQEFVDELVPTRTLKEEFMSVFEEENKILEDLRNAEAELENLGADADPDAMQDVLDRMQKLQAKADAKDVYALESRAKKIMDLMGFTTDEGADKVSMFSGGWKMRIGLGKVLLKEPNILLL